MFRLLSASSKYTPLGLVLLFLSLSTSATAQTFSVQTIDAGSNAFGVKAADIDGDKYPDLLWISNFSQLNVVRNHRDGAFNQTSTTFDFGIEAREFEIADVNHDGIPDAIAAGNHSISVMLGGGAGFFYPPKLYMGVANEEGDTFGSLALADFNGDGNLDAITSDDAGVQIFFGKADGSFTTPPKLLQGSQPAFEVEAGDFDHDGKADFAFVTPMCVNCDLFQVQARFGDGTGNFPVSKQVQGNMAYQRLYIRDVNGDGRSDIVGLDLCSGFNPANGTCSPHLHNWNGHADRTFGAHTASAGTYDDLDGMGFGDFDLDGITDMAAGGTDLLGQTAPDALLIFRRHADNSISSAKVYKIANYGTNGASSVVSADFNKDGKADLALTLNQQGLLQIWRNTTGNSSGCAAGALYTVHICQPSNGSIVPSPVQIAAYARSDSSITAWKVYVDGVSKVQGTGADIKTSITLTSQATQRKITVKAWDAAGHIFSSTVYVTVQ